MLQTFKKQKNPTRKPLLDVASTTLVTL